MSTTAAAVRPVAMLPAFVRQHWRLAALMVCGVLPFAPSLRTLDTFLLADNALGFVPFMLPAAIYVFWVRAHSADGPSKRDVLLDCFFAGPAVFAALFILFLTPAKLSWYFWLYRLDLFAFAFAALAAGFVFLGYQQALRTWQGFALLFLVWPYPSLRVQQSISDPMTAATVWVAHRAVDFLQLPYAVSGRSFTSTHLAEGQNYEIVLAQVCSGSALTIGFLLIGTVLCCLMRGPVGGRLKWLALGTFLAYACNVLRVVVLLAVAAHVNEGFALDVLHPALGLVLFALLTMGMLLLLPAFGLAMDARARGSRVAWEPADGGGKALKGVYVGVLALAALFGVFVVQAQQYAFLGVGTGAPAIDVTSERAILPTVDGWALSHVVQIGWTDLFGQRSRGDLFQYAYPQGPVVIVQVIVADDKASIDRYSIEQCILFHRAKIEALQYVPLPSGVTGVIVHDSEEGMPSSTLYWEQPVRVAGETRHARVALLLDTEEPTKEVDASTLPAPRTIAGKLGVGLTTKFDGRPVAAGDPRSQVDLELIELASKMVTTMVTTGGPARQPAAGG